MLAVLTLLLLAQAGPPSDCRYDRAAMLALDENAFDQDLSGGWRALGNRDCYVEAADLIRDWREAHQAAGLRRLDVSYWHEGQMRAFAGQTAQAAALFARSRRPATEDRMGWNAYVDGSIAFLDHDRTAFDAAYARLAALPKPADYDPRGPDGKPMALAWPININVLDGLRRCWGQPYRTAYGSTCSAPLFRHKVPDK